MSAEEILISQARSCMFTSKVQRLIQDEITKGCSSDLYPQPVALEPSYEPLASRTERANGEIVSSAVFEQPIQQKGLKRFQIWLSPEQPFDWNNNELFIKQLYSTSHRIGFEIIGNSQHIWILLLCHEEDEAVVHTAFRGQFECCELTAFEKDEEINLGHTILNSMQIHDYYPLPPYSHLLTRPYEFKQSPYDTLTHSMSLLSPNEFLWFQVLLQPAAESHNWHHNIELLLDLEYHTKLMNDSYFPHRFAQQLPSGALNQMSNDADNKAHNDKPMFAAAVRMLYASNQENSHTSLHALSTFLRFFQHGGRPLQYITQDDYQSVLSPPQILEMFQSGLTYRPGFIANSLELTGLVHLPSPESWQHRNIPVSYLDSLCPNFDVFAKGTKIGICRNAGQSIPVCLPLTNRLRHTQLIGRSGMGKSSTMEHMILDDIEQGYGVAVLDPHGDLIDRILQLIPDDAIERTVYVDPGDPHWVPLWNPLTPIPGQDVGRMADDLVNAFKAVVTGWGDRLEHLLRHALYALIQLPNTTLLDVSRLMSFRSPESKAIRKRIQDVMQNESARQFWTSDFEKYGKEDFGPPKHKLSKLLLSDTLSLMLSQPENRLDFRRCMDEGKVVLINLSTIGSEVRDILGCFLLAIFRLTALSRSDTPSNQRKPFHIYCDEAHRFVSGTIEDLVAETRKFGVSLTLAHQFLGQFSAQKADALSGMGTSIIFNVDTKDARALSKDLRDMVKIDDLITLDIGEAVVRSGTEIIRVNTFPPLPIPSVHSKEKIIEYSRQHYYKSKQEIRAMIQDGKSFKYEGKSFGYGVNRKTNTTAILDEAFEYDTFD